MGLFVCLFVVFVLVCGFFGWLEVFWVFFQSVELISLKKLVEVSVVELLMYF